MATRTSCSNPMCTCSPCTCEVCRCGVSRLGELESRVMEVLWSDPEREFTGREVAGRLDAHAYTTVATVLDRLSHKELVGRRREGRTLRFSANGTRAAHTAMLMYQVLGGAEDRKAALVEFAGVLQSGDRDALLSALHAVSARA